MAYVIVDGCSKDELCVEACPTDCIHPKSTEPEFQQVDQLYVEPEGCIDCGVGRSRHLPSESRRFRILPSRPCPATRNRIAVSPRARTAGVGSGSRSTTPKTLATSSVQ